MITTLTTARNLVSKLWTQILIETLPENPQDALDVDLATQAILADPVLAKVVVSDWVNKYKYAYIGTRLRERVMGDTETQKTVGGSAELIKGLEAAGMTLMDLKFGKLSLGDYLPNDLRAFADRQRLQAQTMAVRTRFLYSVVAKCDDDTKCVREQLTLAELEELRRNVVESSPKQEIAEKALY